MENVIQRSTAIIDSDFELFLENDPTLQDAYMNAMELCGVAWTDEELAAAAFRRMYGEDANIDPLMQAWRWMQRDDEYAHAVGQAAERWLAEQAKARRRRQRESIRAQIQPLPVS